jgi:hypothetical protein
MRAILGVAERGTTMTASEIRIVSTTSANIGKTAPTFAVPPATIACSRCGPSG